MKYISTRGADSASGPEAIVRGLASDGGLFCPSSFPALTPELLDMLGKLPYYKRAAFVLGMFLGGASPRDGFSDGELEGFAEQAYAPFDGGAQRAAPVTELDGQISLLELWHGPTAAFKDMALRMLPFLMTAGARKIGADKRICILTATSGDTGKAALAGFKDVGGTAVFVFYPRDGVSAVQRLQMVTQGGGNVGVCAINGNFDDAQTGVKRIFADRALAEAADGAGWMLSSANSINPGRLLPQVAYYISAYCDMAASGRLKKGAPLDIAVPTGNFGNILAAYYAREMGLPLGRLVCASNKNDVLTVFLRDGVYDRRRELSLTTSPSMDILVSSNFERALYHLSGGDADMIRDLMRRLSDDGIYTVSGGLRSAFAECFTGGSCDDAGAARVIRETWDERDILLDPHTAVAVDVARRNLTGNPMLVVSTASPFKFCEAVLDALAADGPFAAELDENGADARFDPMQRLSALTGLMPPRPLLGLAGRPGRFTDSVDPSDMPSRITL
ncbi:MAG: threonine synthase, partial [Oscillospiraceae bacterium]|nr:threonine synthase [Oscillospiraceae bacterium]